MPRYQTCDTLLLLLALYKLITLVSAGAWSHAARAPGSDGSALARPGSGVSGTMGRAQFCLRRDLGRTHVTPLRRLSQLRDTVTRANTHYITDRWPESCDYTDISCDQIKPNSFTNKWVEETLTVYEVMKIFSIISMNISNGKQLFVNSIHSLRMDWGRKVLNY